MSIDIDTNYGTQPITVDTNSSGNIDLFKRSTPDWGRDHQVIVYGFRGRPWVVADVEDRIIARSNSYLDCLKLLAGHRQKRRFNRPMLNNLFA